MSGCRMLIRLRCLNAPYGAPRFLIEAHAGFHAARRVSVLMRLVLLRAF